MSSSRSRCAVFARQSGQKSVTGVVRTCGSPTNGDTWDSRSRKRLPMVGFCILYSFLLSTIFWGPCPTGRVDGRDFARRPPKSVRQPRLFSTAFVWAVNLHSGGDTPMRGRSQLTRRDLLKYMGAAGLGLAASGLVRAASPATAVTFVDVARSAGITFQHDNAASPEKFLIETMGSGCGWIDYDQNGLLDLYLVNGAATRVYSPKQPLRSALYRNNGDGTFTDVTASRQGRRRRPLRHGCGCRRFRQRRIPGFVRPRLWPLHSLPQQW